MDLEKRREASKRYYYAHKEEILARQKKYVKERYKTDEDYRNAVLEKNKRYANDHYETIKESKRIAQRKYMNKKRENGELPLTKDMIIEELQQRIDKAIDKLYSIPIETTRSEVINIARETLHILKGE